MPRLSCQFSYLSHLSDHLLHSLEDRTISAQQESRSATWTTGKNAALLGVLVKFKERLSIYIGTADQQSIKQDTKTSAQKSKQTQWVSQW